MAVALKGALRAAPLAAVLAWPCSSLAQAGSERWLHTPHGPMLARVLPRSVTPPELPEPESDGARLLGKYCVQCHHLPNPAMHTAARWRPVVDRMVWRMRGGGNLGTIMKGLMEGVQAPTDAEVASLNAYLGRHAQRAIASEHPALRTEAGQMYSIACSQCHELPDPQQHTAGEWPAVVQRMRRYMAQANTVTGDAALRTSPELRTAEIVRLLQQHARLAGTPR